MVSEVRRAFPMGIDGNERAREFRDFHKRTQCEIARGPPLERTRARLFARSPETLFPRRNLSRSADGRFSFSAAIARSLTRPLVHSLVRSLVHSLASDFPRAISRGVLSSETWEVAAGNVQCDATGVCIAVGNLRHRARQ